MPVFFGPSSTAIVQYPDAVAVVMQKYCQFIIDVGSSTD